MVHGVHLHAREVRDRGAPRLVVLNHVRQIFPANPASAFVAPAEEVTQRLVVDLEEGDLEGPRPALRAHVLSGLEDGAQRTRDDPPARWSFRTLHGEGLAASSLAVREDRHLIPVERGLHQASHLIEHLLLGGRGAEDLVEREGIALRTVAMGKAVGRLRLLESRVAAWRKGLDAAEHADIALELLDGVVKCTACDFGLSETTFERLDVVTLLLHHASLRS